MLQLDHEPATPTNPTTYPLRSRVHAVVPRGLSPHRLYCRRHGGAWPSFDHASFRGISERVTSPHLPLSSITTLPWCAPTDHTSRGCLRSFTVGLFNYCCEAVAVRMPPFQCHRLQDLPQPWQAPSPPAFRSPPAMRICCCKLPAHDHGPVVGLVVFSIAHGYIPAEGL